MSTIIKLNDHSDKSMNSVENLLFLKLKAKAIREKEVVELMRKKFLAKLINVKKGGSFLVPSK